MRAAEVMTIDRLESAGDAIIKKIVSAVCSIPIRILKISFGVQVKLVYLAVDCLVKIYTVIKTRTLANQENISDQEPAVSNASVIKGVKKLRKAFWLSLEEHYGLHEKSDVDEAVKGIGDVRKCMVEGDETETREVLAILKELDKPFEEESWKEKHLKDLEVREIPVDESETDDKSVNMLMPNSDRTQVSSNESSEQEVLFQREIKHEQLNSTLNNRPGRNIGQENGVLRNRLKITNTKLEEVLNMSSNLVAELKELNFQVSRLTSVSERMADMEQKLGEGRKMLLAVEEDRNDMQMKLLTLECMIKEEEQYLDDVSCESGYDECESPNLNHPEL